MLNEEIGYSFDRKGAYLADVRGEFEDAGGNGLIEFQGFVDELDRSD